MPRPRPFTGAGWRRRSGHVANDRPGLETVELPEGQAAIVVHRGPMNTVGRQFQTLARWAAEQGHDRAVALAPQRIVFLEADGDDQSEWLAELQLELQAPSPAAP